MVLCLESFFVFTMFLALAIGLFLVAVYGNPYAAVLPLIAVPTTLLLRRRLRERSIYIVIASVSPIPFFVARTVASMGLRIPRDGAYSAVAWIAGGFLGILLAFLIVIAAAALIDHALEHED